MGNIKFSIKETAVGNGYICPIPNSLKICIFTNDSYFSYLLAKEIFASYHSKIDLVVFSSKVTTKIDNIVGIWRKTNYKYFTYRTFIQLLTYIGNIVGRKTIKILCKKYGIQSFMTDNIEKDIDMIVRKGKWDVGLMFNFDQILNKEMIDLFELGVINIHASKLPEYKGISPALWAFAKGDKYIWVTIYKIYHKIDTGEILLQFKLHVYPGDSAFSLYERISKETGIIIAKILKKYLNGSLRPKDVFLEGEGSYYTWPDKRHLEFMKNNGKRYIHIHDIARVLKQTIFPE